MAHRIAAIPMTLSDRRDHSTISGLFKCSFFRKVVQHCFQNFNWYSASRGPSASAEPLVLYVLSHYAL